VSPETTVTSSSGTPSSPAQIWASGLKQIGITLKIEQLETTTLIQMRNAEKYSIYNAAWTNDTREQEQFINELEAGSVFINGMVASDPRLPFGGVKRSGYGRELSEYGLREFVNVKSVWIA
jgi:ABC-type transport system substrate-binding protein